MIVGFNFQGFVILVVSEFAKKTLGFSGEVGISHCEEASKIWSERVIFSLFRK